MKIARSLVATCLLGVGLGIILPQISRAEDSRDPIRIVTNNWMSQVVLSYVVGHILEEIGNEVDYRSSDSQLQFTAMLNNDMDFQIEVWEGAHGESFEKALAQGVVDVGNHPAITREDWWYPKYVEEICPGLPDWKALDACADKFATAETGTKGRFVGPPASWGKHYADRIEALNMNFQEVAVGQAATLWAELQSAYDRKEPIVLFNWTPNFIEARFEGEFVEFPEFEPACWSDPAWGINPNAVYDCGAPAEGYLKKAASPEFAKKWPRAFEVLKKVEFSNPQIAAVAAMVDVDGLSPEEAAERWLAENETIWKAWIE